MSQRLSELEGLQGDLANADDEEEFSCDGEDEELESEFRGNVEVVRLHRQLLAAKISARASERPKDNGGGRSPKTTADDAHGPAVPTDSDLDDDGAWMDDEDLGQVDPNNPAPAPDANPEVLEAWRAVQKGVARKHAEVYGRMVAAKRHKVQQRG